MKKIALLSMAVLLAISCGKKQQETQQEDEGQVPETKEVAAPVQDQGSKTRELKTSSGKSYLILEDVKGTGLSDVRIIPRGFPNSSDTIFMKAVDPVSKVFLSDLNRDGFEEAYVITTAAGSGSYGRIYGCSSNRDLSATPIHVPELSETDLQPGGRFEGYMGHDSIYLKDQVIYRKFPVYKEGDPNCCPTGGHRTLAYELQPGEASWILKLRE